ncbi:hypothetical protein LCGC14_1634640 [marine sediment metagenome]|uniref:Uncharacterized protein n=1 Tax=marine sediment metagenome TaxID=412755 RepID=A0A0F9L198_9ZZZZ
MYCEICDKKIDYGYSVKINGKKVQCCNDPWCQEELSEWEENSHGEKYEVDKN